jgi:type I restriction enzyme S subunit
MTNLSGANLNNGAAVGPQGEGRESPSRFPKYPAYKDSGVEWLGEVPDHWESRRLKFLFSLQKRPVVDGDGIVTCFRDGAVTLRSNRRTDGFTNAEKEIGYQGIRKGDLVIHAMDAFAGAIGVSDSDGKSSPVYSACTPNEGVSAYYFARLLRHMALAGFVSSLAKGIRERSTDFRWSDASEICLPLPSISEQTQIARFLDHETARIDALIEEQQRLIELLKEKRQAVISHAVTKGLDPTVPMKDSGVEWLGEVPAHWDVGGLTRFIGPVVDYRGRTPTKVDEGVFLVTARNIRNGRIDYEASQEYVDPASAESLLARGRPEIGDLLFTMEAPLGQVALIDRTDIALAQRIVKFRGEPHVMKNHYLMYWFMSTVCQARLETLATGSTALGIKASKLGMIECLAPSLKEQDEIISYIQRETAKSDTLVFETEQVILLLQERRSALISAAVTGKIDVRGWQPPANTQAPEIAVAEAN